MADEAGVRAVAGASGQAAPSGGHEGRKVAAFPSGEAVFPEEPPLAGSPDMGDRVLQALLWGLIAACGVFVLAGAVRTLRILATYY